VLRLTLCRRRRAAVALRAVRTPLKQFPPRVVIRVRRRLGRVVPAWLQWAGGLELSFQSCVVHTLLRVVSIYRLPMVVVFLFRLNDALKCSLSGTNCTPMYFAACAMPSALFCLLRADVMPPRATAAA
jgi:hypothetical protein